LPFRIAEVCAKTSKTQLISCKSNKKNGNYQKWRTIVIVYCFINPLTILRVIYINIIIYTYIYIYPYIPHKPCNSTSKVLTLQHIIASPKHHFAANFPPLPALQMSMPISPSEPGFQFVAANYSFNKWTWDTYGYHTAQ
jgi:hypothetical protein